MPQLTAIDRFASAHELEDELHIENYPMVFTEVSARQCGGETYLKQILSYIAVVGQTADINLETGVINAIDDRIYVISLTPSHANSRAYDGIAGFYREKDIYFALLIPSEQQFPKMTPALRWRFRLAFEYPRRRKRGFIIPTINASHLAYCFISEAERGKMEHLCPPMPIARYNPEEFGYTEDELREYLESEERRREHAQQLYPMIESIFARTKGELSQYIPMSKELIPRKYRSFELLYDAEILGSW